MKSPGSRSVLCLCHLVLYRLKPPAGVGVLAGLVDVLDSGSRDSNDVVVTSLELGVSVVDGGWLL